MHVNWMGEEKEGDRGEGKEKYIRKRDEESGLYSFIVMLIMTEV